MTDASNYTSISGSWTVPTVVGNDRTTSADAAWIGIGGVTSDDLIQTGTIDSVSAGGRVTYSCFYELLPQSALEIEGLPVSAGDTMSANIHETGTDTWVISITDNTSNETYSTSVTYDSSESSAEWIEEDPSSSHGLLPLDTFGSVTFDDGTTTTPGAYETIGAAGSDPITLVNGYGQTVATPSAVTADGQGFTVTQNS